MLNLLRRMWSSVSQLGSGCLGCLTPADKEELAALGAVWTVVMTHPPVIPMEGRPVGQFFSAQTCLCLGKELSFWVSYDRLLNFSELQHAHLSVGNDGRRYSRGLLWGVSKSPQVRVWQEPGTWEQPANSSDCFSWCSRPVGVIVNVIYFTPCLGQELASLREGVPNCLGGGDIFLGS